MNEFLSDNNKVAASFDHHLADSTWKFVVGSQDGCLTLALEGAPLDPFPWKRILKAGFFVRTRNRKWAQLGGIKEQSVGSETGATAKRERAVPRNVNTPFISHCIILLYHHVRTLMLQRLDCCDPECATIGVNFYVARYLGSEQSAEDDVKFVAQGQPVYAKKAVRSAHLRLQFCQAVRSLKTVRVNGTGGRGEPPT